jgi:hypothetical protein
MNGHKTVEQEIRDYYLADNGEWIVEKGKMKEAKLLKQAVQRIESLKNELNWFSKKNLEFENLIEDKIASRRKDLNIREEALRKRENELNRRIDDAVKALSYIDKRKL